MPVNFSSLAKVKRTRTIDIETVDGPQPLSVTYYPNAQTPELDERVQQLVDEGVQPTEVVFRRLSAQVESWDLLGSDGAPLPISQETCHLLGYSFVNDVLTQLNQVTSGKKPKSASSAS